MQHPQDHCRGWCASKVDCVKPITNGCDWKTPKCHKGIVGIGGLPYEWKGSLCHGDGVDMSRIALESFVS
jgi:hypothetical protein